jgi:chemotaxis protein histidine kinase CheA
MLEEKLRKARQDYVEKLRSRLVELGRLMDRARGTACQPADLRDAQQLAHKLCGTAGTFGFTGVSEALRRLDRLLLALLADPAASASRWTEAEEALQSALDQVKRPDP